MDVLCKGARTGGMLDEYTSNDITTFECKQSYINPLTWFKLWRTIVRGKYSVVCDFTGDFAGIPMLVARLAGVPKRITWYRNAGAQYKSGLRTLYARIARQLVLWNATDILSNSQANLDTFHPHRKPADGRFEVIANGIPTGSYDKDRSLRDQVRASLGLAQNIKAIGHVGSFRYQKNHHAIVEVAKRLRDQRDDFIFILIGDGPLREQVETSITKAELSAHFMLLGLRDDVPQLLQAMDAFFFPSFYEGQPNALIEAMMSGLPFVASLTPAIIEAIRDEDAAYCAPPTDYDALTRLVSARLSEDLTGKNRSADSMRQWCNTRYSMTTNIRRVTDRMNTHLNTDNNV